MNRTCETILRPGLGVMASDFPSSPQMQPQINPQNAILDMFIPGFSIVSSALSRYTKIDLNIYFPVILFVAIVIVVSQYFNEWIWEFADAFLMSTADIRVDDEMYNMVMSWIAHQKFSQKSRRFVANTNINSRYWFFRWDSEDEDKEEGVEFDNEGNPIAASASKNNKEVQFTPSFGTHYFWYKKRLLIFRRQQDQRQSGYMSTSEREEISISSFGRNPRILKELLDECRSNFSKNDENRTIIYRGGTKTGGNGEPTWTRCVSRVSRPFSTVVLDEEVKKSLLDDMRDYLHPLTRRWYSNRGIPYRRGYLFYGFPGTGKSSLSLAVAGYFKLQIYIVSLNSPAMNEENLSTLFIELPKQCVVLLEDIDTAGLTHARGKPEEVEVKPTPPTTGSKTLTPPPTGGKISLSALLNILDGVASQEGRVLIMTTNHIEKLDEALIRPGRVDMTIKFDLANTQMITTLFQYIFATLEGDIPPSRLPLMIRPPKSSSVAAKLIEDEKMQKKLEEEMLARKYKEDERVAELGQEIAKLIPSLTFSPAEIQGFFLKYKRQPELAVKEAKGWVEKTLREKREKDDEEKKEKKKAEEVVQEKSSWGWNLSL